MSLACISAATQVWASDLHIAAIVLAHNALLITRNLQDFQRIPNLRLEDWTK